MRSKRGLPAGHTVPRLPWWTWIVPGPVCLAGALVSSFTNLAPGLSVLHWSFALGLAMSFWWGARVLAGVFLCALLTAWLQASPLSALWPLFALPETAAVAAAFLLSTRLAPGSHRLTDMPGVIRFIFFIIAPACLIFGVLTSLALGLSDPLKIMIFPFLVQFSFVTAAVDCLSLTAALLIIMTPLLEERGLSRSSGSMRQALPPARRPVSLTRLRIAAGILAIALLGPLLPFPRYSFLLGIFSLMVATRFGLAAAALTNFLTAASALLLPHLVKPELGPIWSSDNATASLYGLGLLYISALAIGRSIDDHQNEMERRRIAEQVVRLGESRFRTIVENIQEGLSTLVPDGRMSFVNDRLCSMLGYPREELLGRPFIELVDEPDRVILQRNFALREQGLPSIYELAVRRKDGKPLTILIAGGPLLDENSKFQGTIGVITDITGLKQTEASLKSRLELNQAAGDMDENTLIHFGVEQAVRGTGSEIGYFHLFSADSQMVHAVAWSAGARRLCTAAAASHWPLSEAGVWADPVRFGQPVIHNDFQALSGRSGYPEGHVHVERHCSVPVFEDGRPRAILGVGNRVAPYDQADTRALQIIGEDLWNIIRRKRAEEKLRTSLQEKEILIQEVHHRVKNNLALIVAFLNLESTISAGRHSPAEMFRESQNRIRSMALVHEKLYLSGNFSLIDASDYLISLVREIIQSSLCPARVLFDFDTVQLDIDRLIPCGLIVNELVTNAVKYAFARQADGELKVSLKRDSSRPATGRAWLLCVEDNGPGLPPDLLQKEPDSMGLKIVFLLTKQLKGEIESSAGTGNTGSRIRIRFEAGQPDPA